MTETYSNIEWLQAWYKSQCNGEWEHSFGIKIDTLDNPGWSIDVDLSETHLAEGILRPISAERGKSDWIWCTVENRVFKGRGGPQNLNELVGEFRKWVTEQQHSRGHSRG